MKQRELILSWDGRCDSTGHNAKYLTYLLSDQSLKRVISVSLTQVTEVEGVSNKMEKTDLIEVPEEMKRNEIKQLTTDQHLQAKKYLREQEEGIDHQFDVWHFSKSIKIKLLKFSKKKAGEELRQWIKSIFNNLWWLSATCEQHEMLLKEKWVSLLFHMLNKRYSTGHALYQQCCHRDLST